jgi:hypothetical protein
VHKYAAPGAHPQLLLMIVVGIDSMLKVRRMSLAPTGVLFSSFESTPERASTAIDERAAECQETSHAARTHPWTWRWNGAAQMERCSSDGAVQLRWSGTTQMERCSSDGAVQLRLSGTTQIVFMAPKGPCVCGHWAGCPLMAGGWALRRIKGGRAPSSPALR